MKEIEIFSSFLFSLVTLKVSVFDLRSSLIFVGIERFQVEQKCTKILCFTVWNKSSVEAMICVCCIVVVWFIFCCSCFNLSEKVEEEEEER